MKIHIWNIQWDTDGHDADDEDDAIPPSEMTLDVWDGTEPEDDGLTQALEDETGWTALCFDWEVE